MFSCGPDSLFDTHKSSFISHQCFGLYHHLCHKCWKWHNWLAFFIKDVKMEHDCMGVKQSLWTWGYSILEGSKLKYILINKGILLIILLYKFEIWDPKCEFLEHHTVYLLSSNWIQIRRGAAWIQMSRLCCQDADLINWTNNNLIWCLNI